MNHIVLIGNLVADPELRTTVSGKSVCNFRIAVRKRFTGQAHQDNGQPQQDADFFSIVTWDRIAENCSKFLAKGRKVCVIGSISNRKFEGRDGTTRYTMEVNASEVEFLSSQSAAEPPAQMPDTPPRGAQPPIYADPGDEGEFPF